MVETLVPGCAVRHSPAAQEPALRRHRGAVAGHRHRGEHDDLLHRKRAALPSAARDLPIPARLVDIGRTQDGQRLRHRLVPELPRRARAHAHPRRRVRLPPRTRADEPRRTVRGPAHLRDGRQRQLLLAARHAARCRPVAPGRRRQRRSRAARSSSSVTTSGSAASTAIRSLVGQTITINSRPFAVVGIAPRGFQGTTLIKPDAWVPMSALTEATPRMNAEHVQEPPGRLAGDGRTAEAGRVASRRPTPRSRRSALRSSASIRRRTKAKGWR